MLQVLATNADDAVSSNNGVSYSILSQVPEQPQPGMFTINSSSELVSVAMLGLVAEVSPGLSPHRVHPPLVGDAASCHRQSLNTHWRSRLLTWGESGCKPPPLPASQCR